MKLALTIASAMLVAATASGGQNPDIRIYLDTDPPDHVHEVAPQYGELFDVYICFDCFGAGGGTRGAGVLLQRTFSGFKMAQESLLGGLDFGDVEVDGWTIVAGADCVYPYNPEAIVVAAKVTYLYLGVPGTLDLLPHPGTGREVIDCDFSSDFYCVHANLGVGVPPNPGNPDCECLGPPTLSVKCEPQGGYNPVHPPGYWFAVQPGYDQSVYGFHVQVFDDDLSNYDNWDVHESWAAPDSVRHYGDELWISWCDPELANPLQAWSPYRFRFENPNPSAWGHWTLTGALDPCDPFANILARSHEFWYRPDGYGHRVHVPMPPTPVTESSWGTIKALYRD